MSGIAPAGLVERLRLAPEIALRDVAPHGEAVPQRLLGDLISGGDDRICKEDRDHRLRRAVSHFEAPRDRRTRLIEPAENLRLGRLALRLESLRGRVFRGAFVLADT